MIFNRIVPDIKKIKNNPKNIILVRPKIILKITITYRWITHRTIIHNKRRNLPSKIKGSIVNPTVRKNKINHKINIIHIFNNFLKIKKKDYLRREIYFLHSKSMIFPKRRFKFNRICEVGLEDCCKNLKRNKENSIQESHNL